MEEKWYDIVICYFRQYRLSALMFLLFSGIFTVVFSLYQVETEAVWYASALCILAASVVLAVHFYFYYKGHRERRKIMQNLSLLTKNRPPDDFGVCLATEKLPEPQTLAERSIRK